ncbi:MAG: antibiotic biosynthesis monooxygenase [Alphaproteobacteria bacterium]|nr:antibiotic biosynthesis monooxygenase [Alphaproteobacteria bacterium]
MIAVIFEVFPGEGEKSRYLDIAGQIKPELEKIPGFISVERFQSLTNPDKVLSLSFFEDEKALENWRNLEAHREAQNHGRNGVFRDYRLRVASVLRDYGLNERDQAPTDSKNFHR